MDKTSDLEILERLSTTCEWVGAVIMRQRRRPRYSTLDMTSSELWLLTTLFLIGQYWPQLETDVLMQTLTGRRFLKDNQTRGQDNGPISFEGGAILWWECGEVWPFFFFYLYHRSLVINNILHDSSRLVAHKISSCLEQAFSFISSPPFSI